MEPIIIARTPERERYDVDNGRFYCEWRVRELHDPERCELINKYHLNWQEVNKAYIMEARRMDVDGATGEATPYNDWQIYGFGQTIRLTIRELIGDSSFQEANSLCDEHRAEVERVHTYRKLMLSKRNIETEISILKQDADSQYQTALKKARLWSKAQKDEAPQDKIDAIQKPILESYHKKLKELKSKLKDADKKIAEFE